jgi:hypothetical protein
VLWTASEVGHEAPAATWGGEDGVGEVVHARKLPGLVTKCRASLALVSPGWIP